MQKTDNSPFLEPASPLTLGQCAKENIELRGILDGVLVRLANLERLVADKSHSGEPQKDLPVYPGVDWGEVAKRFPNLKLNMRTATKFLEQRLRLNGEPSLKTLVAKQELLERTNGTHYRQLQHLWGCSYNESLAFIWFLKQAGLAKEWVQKDTYCRTDLKYTYSSRQ